MENVRINTTNTIEFRNIISCLLTNSVADNNAKKSEYMAYYGAMELLIPKNYTESDDFLNGDNKQLAERIKVPTQIIEIRKNMCSEFENIYKDIQFPNARILDLASRSRSHTKD